MKIAVVGCGAVGAYYGAKLFHQGSDVHFLLRTDYETVRREGVRILSPTGDFGARPRAASRPEEIGVCDLVVIGLKTTANAEFPRLLPPLVGPHTMVLTLQNGLGNEAQLAELFPEEQILGGLCFVCLNRIAPGVVRHSAHGHIVLGEFRRPPAKRTHDLAQLFVAAGVPCAVAEGLEQAHWEKLVWNIPFNGVGVAGVVGYDNLIAGVVPRGFVPAACLPTDRLLSDRNWERLICDLMREVIAAANAVGFPVAQAQAERNLDQTRCMGAYKASTLLDFEQRRPLELESLFLEPQRQAHAAGCPTPWLDKLCLVLGALDRMMR
jgi:2-dehydropantoate 2-reductase